MGVPPRGAVRRARRFRADCTADCAAVRRPLLLLVALDGLGIADVGLLGVFPELPAGPALAQEIPTLIELDLERVVALMVLGRAVGLLVELVLLVDEVLDMVKDALVVHGDLRSRFPPRTLREERPIVSKCYENSRNHRAKSFLTPGVSWVRRQASAAFLTTSPWVG